MKNILILLLIQIVFTACASYPIQMKEVPVKLVKIDLQERYSGNKLLLYWESLDNKIYIQTEALPEDSSYYTKGALYTRAFLPR